MAHFSWKTVGFLFAFLGLVWACSTSKDTPDPDPDPNPTNPVGTDRKAMLTHLADNIILPGYANFKTKFDLMRAKSEAFAAKPDQTTLTEFRQAWVDAYTEWQKVELFDVGPAESQTLRYFFNIYPANVTGIEENIVSGSAVMDLPAAYPKQGFPALDYLINGLAATDDAILLRYTTATDAAKRIAYLKRITTQMNTVFTAVLTEWTTGGYRDKFVNCTGIDAGCSTSKLVNGYVLHYERYIRSGKFGIPSGVMANGVAAPEKVEAFYKKDLSLVLAKTAHQAAIDFFNGKDVKTGQEGPGFKSYLNALGAKDSQTGKSLVEVINAQFESTNAKLNALKPNLHDEIKTNNAAVVAVYTEMQKAVRMLKVDMTSAMSITITYVDTDGD